MKIKLLFISLIFSNVYAIVNRDVCTFISPRSPTVNAARELTGWENIINVYSSESTYGAFAINPEVTLSFRPERIAQCIFGDDIVHCLNRLTIAGSQCPVREQSTAWLADYFGLPTDYESVVEFDPKMSNALVDLNLFVGWDRFIPGLYFRIHSPLVYTRWDLTICEELITTGSNAHDPGYFNAEGVPRIQLVDNFVSFIGGLDAPKATGLAFRKLCKAKMSCPALRMVSLSDIEIALGYNVLHNKQYHLGGNIRFSIPAGNRPNGEFLFEPIVGNGHHWAVGGGLSTHIVIWDNEQTEEKAALYLDMNITHLFKTDQKRSFDLHSSPNSRYMLAEKMGTPIEDNLRGIVGNTRVEPNRQYKEEVTTIANLTTLPIEVSINVQADLVFMLAYTKERDSWTFGYNFWGRSCDCITLCNRIPFEAADWAIKGDSFVFGFEDTLLRTPVALSATQSEATVNSGKNFQRTGKILTTADIDNGKTNLNIDKPFKALSDSDNTGVFSLLLSGPGGPEQINTSIQPKLLRRSDINIDSARTRGISHTMFSSFTHIITSRDLCPYIGFGAGIEFGQSSQNRFRNPTCKKPCINTAFSQWGVWLKGGVAF